MKLLRRIPHVTIEDWKTEVACKHCWIVWEINEKDLYAINTAVRWDGEEWDPSVVFKCQECGEEIPIKGCYDHKLELSEVPYSIYEQKVADLRKQLRKEG